jgi:sodium transport system permease protein
MRALLTVYWKEVLETLRDRRTLWSALVFGPLFGPLLFGVMVSHLLDQNVIESEQPLSLHLCGATRAPGLVRYLESQGVRLTLCNWPLAEASSAVRHGTAQVVLVVPEDYPSRLIAAAPAPLYLVADSADSQTRKVSERAHRILGNYASGIAQQRLQIRGIDPLLAIPVAVDDVDVATPSGRAVVVLGFMTYFVLFAVLVGGLYLAIDSTAGERERGSLEALLCLPVPRSILVGGKILATCAFMCLSLAISLITFVCVLHYVPLEPLGMSANMGLATVFKFFAICLPFVPLGATLMTLVASFTRSYREAQTYLTAVLLVPTLPIAFASIYSLKTHPSLMIIPSLSQHLLMTSVLKGESLAPLDMLVSATASLGLALFLGMLTARHWRRETLLG